MRNTVLIKLSDLEPLETASSRGFLFMRKLTTNKFIEKSLLIHNNKYDYSKVEYKNSHFKVIIICKIHGEFLQKPHTHLNGQGCNICGGSKPTTQKEFIIKANQVHDFKYNYSKFIYINNKTKGIIICPKHGEFLQMAISHLLGSNCIKCVNENRGWNNIHWNKQSLSSSNFDSFKVYIIRCWNENEEFYKIGKTFLDIKKRFENKYKMPYNYEIVKVFESKNNYKYINNLEKQLHKKHKIFRYQPKTKFGGWNECFSNFISFHDDQ